MRIFLILLILVFAKAQAGEVVETHRNVRSAAMGGVYMSIVNDADAIFVNPAALARVNGLNWQVMNVEFGVNGIDMYNDFRNIDTSDPNSFNQFFGKDLWFRLGAKTAVAMPYFAMGLYTDTQTHFELHNPAFPQFDTKFISDYGVLMGGAIPIGPGTAAGFTLKRITRWGGQKDIDLGIIATGNPSDITSQFQNKGNGYGVDLALQTVIPAPFSPTLSLVWQDVGSTAFTMTNGTDAPPRIRDNLSVGFSTLVDLPGLDWTTGLEYRHATESEYQFGQKVHLGTEVSLPLIDLRAGLNQGYVSYGAAVDFFFLRFDVASYTEEMGAYPGQSPQNRVEFGLSVDLSFDANFSFSGADGKRRKLKQRR